METTNTPTSEFNEGTAVVYGMHGRCVISGVLTRDLGGKSVRCYKLDIQKSALSRSNRKEPSIWIPIEQAHKNGLRAVMTRDGVTTTQAILNSREYYFPVNEPWNQIQPRLEKTILLEGGPGLAKVMSYLHVIKQKTIVLPMDIARFEETVRRLITRELAEILGKSIKDMEVEVVKSMRHKLLPDS